MRRPSPLVLDLSVSARFSPSVLVSPSVLAFLLALGCGAGEGGTRASLTAPEDEAGSTRASREERVAGEASTTPSTTSPAPTPTAPATAPLTLSRLEGPSEAEDGAGNLLSSERAVAIDLDASAFPPRALDPVLRIGALRLSHYRHPRLGVLRFVAASPELLVEGSTVSVQYGDETPVIVSASLSVPASVRR